MNGGKVALWRTSLCGVVIALTVIGTGCAVETANDAEVDDTTEITADLLLASPVAPDSPESMAGGAGGKSPTNDLVEPEPEPWKPHARAIAVEASRIDRGTMSNRSGDSK